EFYRPIEIAESLKRGVRVRAVGFQSIGDANAPAATVSIYLDYWEPASKNGARWPATVALWFGGFHVVNIDEAVRTQVGFQGNSVIEAGITETCKHVARNLWDFVTSRSIRYNQVTRKPLRSSAHRQSSNDASESDSQFDRQVTFLYLSDDRHSSSGQAE